MLTPKFRNVQRDDIYPEHPQFDKFRYRRVFSSKDNPFIFRGNFKVLLKGKPVLDIANCSEGFVNQMVDLLNDSYNKGRSDMKKDIWFGTGKAEV